MLTIVSIDPGGTTGWSTYSAEVLRMNDPEDPPINEYWSEKFLCGQLGPQEHHADLYAFLERSVTSEFVLIGERFDFRGDDRSDINLMAREYIGVMKLFAQERGVDVVWQWPFEGVGKKSFIQPSHLQALKIWVKGGSKEWVHAMDAYRHMLYFMTAKPNEYIDPVKRKELLRKMGK